VAYGSIDASFTGVSYRNFVRISQSSRASSNDVKASPSLAVIETVICESAPTTESGLNNEWGSHSFSAGKVRNPSFDCGSSWQHGGRRQGKLNLGAEPRNKGGGCNVKIGGRGPG